MDINEAISSIMDALGERVSEFDEAFGAISDAVKGTGKSGDGYKEKYEDLLEKYKARFNEVFQGDGGTQTVTDDPVVETKGYETMSMEELLSGDNE